MKFLFVVLCLDGDGGCGGWAEMSIKKTNYKNTCSHPIHRTTVRKTKLTYTHTDKGNQIPRDDEASRVKLEKDENYQKIPDTCRDEKWYRQILSKAPKIILSSVSTSSRVAFNVMLIYEMFQLPTLLIITADDLNSSVKTNSKLFLAQWCLLFV